MRDMREILFRGKRVDNGEWIYGSLLSFPEGKPFIVSEETLLRCKYCGNDIVSCAEEIIPETRGEYTGLTDKNSVKIFEGDIVYCCGGEFCQGYHEVSQKVVVKDITDGVCVFLGEVELLKIIGNIHDNQELLEGGGEK